MWRLAAHPPEVRLLDSDFRQAPDAAIGDGGTQVFHLVADAPGTFEVSFVLKRPWEDEAVLTNENSRSSRRSRSRRDRDLGHRSSRAYSAVSSTRVDTSSLVKTRRRRPSTVKRDVRSRSATSAFVRPWATSVATSRSVGVRASHPEP